jgi:hypothetical protein
MSGMLVDLHAYFFFADVTTAWGGEQDDEQRYIQHLCSLNTHGILSPRPP